MLYKFRDYIAGNKNHMEHITYPECGQGYINNIYMYMYIYYMLMMAHCTVYNL